MLAIASIRDSMSGDYIFVEKINDQDFLRGSTKPWQLAMMFHEKMAALPNNIIIIHNDEEIARFYAGVEYPAEGDWLA